MEVIIATGFRFRSLSLLVNEPSFSVIKVRKRYLIPWQKRVARKNTRTLMSNTPDVTENIPYGSGVVAAPHSIQKFHLV